MKKEEMKKEEMKKEDMKTTIELFNYSLEVRNMRRLNIIISIFFVSALNLTVLVFCVNSFLGKVISITFCLIVWFAGVGYGLIYQSKKHKEMIKYKNKIKKHLKQFHNIKLSSPRSKK